MESLNDITASLRSREPVFHCEPAGSDRAHFEAMLVEDYFEVGASGRVYTRERVIETAVDRYERDDPGVDNELEDFLVLPIGDHLFLATYTLHQPDGHSTRTTRRSTIWTDAGSLWQVVYHQGTIVDGVPD
jgi:hypothetical protein